MDSDPESKALTFWESLSNGSDISTLEAPSVPMTENVDRLRRGLGCVFGFQSNLSKRGVFDTRKTEFFLGGDCGIGDSESQEVRDECWGWWVVVCLIERARKKGIKKAKVPCLLENPTQLRYVCLLGLIIVATCLYRSICSPNSFIGNWDFWGFHCRQRPMLDYGVKGRCWCRGHFVLGELSLGTLR